MKITVLLFSTRYIIVYFTALTLKELLKSRGNSWCVGFTDFLKL